MTKYRGDARNERRLKAAGWEVVDKKSGKRFWRNPKTGEVRVEDAVLQMLRHAEVRMLQEAGWELTEVEGYTYWRRPDSGHLYPEAVAVGLVSGAQQAGSGGEEAP